MHSVSIVNHVLQCYRMPHKNPFIRKLRYFIRRKHISMKVSDFTLLFSHCFFGCNSAVAHGPIYFKFRPQCPNSGSGFACCASRCRFSCLYSNFDRCGLIFTARCYAYRGLCRRKTSIRPSVYLSVCLHTPVFWRNG